MIALKGNFISNNQIVKGSFGTVYQLGEEERKELLAQIESLRLELQETEQEIERLEQELAKADEDKQVLQVQINALTELASELSAEIKRLEAEVDKAFAEGQESMIDRSKVIEKTAIGNGIVSLNDVSEIPHSVGVKVESRNLFDISKAVTISANNTVSVSGDTVTIGLSSDGKAYGFKVPNDGEIEVGKTYTFSVGDVSEHERGYGFRFYYVDGTYEQTTRVPKTVTVEKEVKDILFYVGFYEVAFKNDIVVKQPQVELGTTATPYTEYVEDITQVEVRQVGKNLISLQPYMTGGVYNKAVGTVFEKGEDSRVSYVVGENSLRFESTEGWFGCLLVSPKLKKGTYSYSIKSAISNPSGSQRRCAYVLDENMAVLSCQHFVTKDDENYIGSITLSEEKGYIGIGVSLSVVGTIEVQEVQLEVGTTPTPYEPYTEHTFTPNADGVVDGVKSISPTMHIMTDKAVDISVDYWKSFGMNEFIERYEQGGKRTDFRGAYAGVGWTKETFEVHHDLMPNNAQEMFYLNPIKDDLVELLEKMNVKLDTSKGTVLQYMFQYSSFTRIGVISFENATALASVFSNCANLRKIDKIKLRTNGTNTFSNTFQNCRALENLTIEGVIGQNIDFSYSPLLDFESLLSILTALSKDSTLASGKTVTFATASKAIIEADTKCSEQLALAVGAGWTVAYTTR